MSFLTRTVCLAAIAVGSSFASAADAAKDSPFAQAGSASSAATTVDSIEFSGVSTVGKKTMINLYDKRDKRSFWVEAGTTVDGLTVVNYDNNHDQITVRANGAEKLLPLRPPSAVVNGTTTPAPLAPAPIAPAAAPTGPTQPAAPLSQARQEEEARMLVSDLLEIGMAQRKAYEEAQRRAAAGQTAQPPQQTQAATAQTTATPSGAPGTAQADASAGQPAQAAQPSTPSGG